VNTLLIRDAVPWSGRRALDGDAIAIVGGRVAAIGSLADARAAVPEGTAELDARGGLVTPGFVDAHLHLGVVATDSMHCDLAGAGSRGEIAVRIRAFADDAHGPWILGGGWDRALFAADGPTAAALDELVPDRPALFYDADHHAGWVNSRALDLAGIEAATPDPGDGRIGRLADRTPSGFLAEGALQLIARVLPEPDTDELATAIGAASQRLLAAGITGWQEAALGAFAGFPDFSDAYLRAIASGRLRGRATGAVWVPRDLTVEAVDEFVAACLEQGRRNTAGDFPTATAKLMLDGVVETRTAALIADYDAHPGERGLVYFAPEVIQRVIPALNAAGIAVHVHAIGDRAVRDALDGFAAADPDARARVRNHIAHLELVTAVDVPRFASLGATANLQPYWAGETELTRTTTLPLLGPERASRLFVFRSLQDAGASLAMGSDWPVSTYEPWQGIHVAVNRRAPGDTECAPLGAGEALRLEDAVDAYTRGSATLLGIPGDGVLRVGAPADLAIADRDPFVGEAADIHLTRTVATVLDGEVVAGG